MHRQGFCTPPTGIPLLKPRRPQPEYDWGYPKGGEGTGRTATPSASTCHLSHREICPEILWTFAISKQFSHFLPQSYMQYKYKCWWVGARPK